MSLGYIPKPVWNRVSAAVKTVEAMGRPSGVGGKVNSGTYPMGLMPVDLTSDGGSPGSGTTACTLTYTLKHVITGATLDHPVYQVGGQAATTIAPKMQRSTIGKMKAATHGLAFVGKDGLWWLWWCDEAPDSGQGCS